MARHQNPSSADRSSRPAEEVTTEPDPTNTPEASRKGMRGHDDQGNVRPADGRYELHRPEDESKYVRAETPSKGA